MNKNKQTMKNRDKVLRVTQSITRRYPYYTPPLRSRGGLVGGITLDTLSGWLR